MLQILQLPNLIYQGKTLFYQILTLLINISAKIAIFLQINHIRLKSNLLGIKLYIS